MIKKDNYKILGIPPVATLEEIKKAYRAASKKYHPDLNPDLKLYSEEKMRELVGAYEVLSDVDKRKEYDKQPFFQLRRARKVPSKYAVPDPKKKGHAKPLRAEGSLLDRLFAPFMKKSETGTGVHLDPKKADERFTLGLSLANNESFFEQAISEFKLALKYDPEHVEALYNIGILCYKLGMFEESVVHFQKVLAISKEDPYAKRMIAILSEDY